MSLKLFGCNGRAAGWFPLATISSSRSASVSRVARRTPRRPRLSQCKAALHTSQMYEGYAYPLLLSTLAGLSTSIGGALAVTKQPDEATLAWMLGAAIGVMATVSAVELWLKNALEGNPLLVSLAVLVGAGAFCLLEPLLPKEPDAMEREEVDLESNDSVTVLHISNRDVDASTSKVTATKATARNTQRPGGATGSSNTNTSPASSLSGPSALAADSPSSSPSTPLAMEPLMPGARLKASEPSGKPWGPAGAAGSHHPGLLRLGVLMAVTMTLHNLPEGFAVAFSAFTDVGPLMAVAIALHNIPEGLVVAAPIYAATGSRWQALGVATASGLSEPLGAAVALLMVKPFVTSVQRLDLVLAFVGGVMLAVCVVELWPEGRKCKQDRQLLQGIALGTFVMGWTLYIGV